MKTRKGLLTLALAICVVALLVGGCGQQPAATTAAAPPTTSAPLTTSVPTTAAPLTTTAPTTAAPTTTTSAPTTTAAAAKTPIKIGFLASLTGFLAEPGYPEAVKTFPEYYGTTVNGQPYQIIVEDDASDPATALTKAKTLVETDGCQFIVGPLNGAAVMTVGDYCTKMNIPNFVIAPGIMWSQKADPANNLGMLFLASGSMNGEDYILGQYMYQQGIRTVDTIGTDFAAGYGFIGSAVKGFTDVGGKVIQQQWIPPSDMDMAPYVTNLKKADAVIWWIASAAGPMFQQIYKQYGITMPLYRTDGAEYVTDTDLDKLGETTVGMKGVAFYMWTLDNPENQKWVDTFVKVNGHFPGEHATQPALIFKIILDTIKASGGYTDSASFVKQMESMTFDTWRGPVSFTSDGGVISNVYLYEDQMVNGKVIPVLIKTFPNVDTRQNSPPENIGKDYTGG